jgi:hypothetical protein
MINVADTILTQYADSPKLKSLIYSFNEAVGIEDFLDDFYDVIWNIQTADTYGLDVGENRGCQQAADGDRE